MWYSGVYVYSVLFAESGKGEITSAEIKQGKTFILTGTVKRRRKREGKRKNEEKRDKHKTKS